MDRDFEEAVKLCGDLYKHVRKQCLEKCRELTMILTDCGCNLALIDLEEMCLASMGIEVERDE